MGMFRMGWFGVGGTFVDVDGTAEDVDGTAVDVDGTAVDVDGTVVAVGGTVVDVDGRAETVGGTAVEVDDFEVVVFVGLGVVVAKAAAKFIERILGVSRSRMTTAWLRDTLCLA